ncbi:hypothetical protein AAFF_G00404020 [Aldrovandia affinis]|uniref:Uncharacterized protein n=1 Tax=Aldrovandia affinis TaxID=143900 RepID=A0AAD7X0K0_9TELE|nr:hypothetical protein AAFF_G00404020 [Aldrovandia affinis]
MPLFQKTSVAGSPGSAFLPGTAAASVFHGRPGTDLAHEPSCGIGPGSGEIRGRRVSRREPRLRPHKQPAVTGNRPDFTQRASQSLRFLSGAAQRQSERLIARRDWIMSLCLTFLDTVL